MSKTKILSFLLAVILLLGMCSVGVFATEVSTAPEVVGQQLNLGDDLTMHFTVKADAGTVVNATVNGQANTFDLSTMTPDSQGQYVLAVELAAAQMTEDITLDFVHSGATVLQKTYSVRAYAEAILEGNYSARTKKMVRHMLHYGAAAQEYFGIQTDNLANKGYELTGDVTLPTDYTQMLVDGKLTGAGFYGASLVFQSKIAVRYYFYGNVDGVSFTVDGNHCQVQEKDTLHYVEVSGINPQQYAESFTISATKGDEVLTVSYSPLNYIVRMSEKSDKESLKDLLKALYSYHDTALEYVTEVSFFGNVDSYSSTSQLDLSKDTGANTGTVTVSENGIALGYIDSFREDNFYFETKIHVNGIKSTEKWPKFGLFVQDGGVRHHFYVDMTTSLTSTKVGRMTVTDNSYDWTNINTATIKTMAFSGEGEYITMGVLKEGKYLHLFVDGVHALSYESALTGDAVAGIFTFGTNMTLTEYFAETSAESVAARKAMIPRYVQDMGDETVFRYDAATDTITIDMDSSNNRARAQLYENGILVEGKSFAVSGHAKMENTASTGSAASMIEFQAGKDTSNFFKILVYRFDDGTTSNNSICVTAADSGNGYSAFGYVTKQNEDGSFSVESGANKRPDNLPKGDPYEVDYLMIFENGTVYFILDGELMYRYEGTCAEMAYYFGVTQYADVTYTNTKATCDAAEVAKLSAPYRADANNGVALTTDHTAFDAASGIYTLNTDTAVAETVLKDGTALKETYYRVGGTIYNNGTASWAQSHITVKADDTHAVRFVLERTDKGYYQVFTEKNVESENWTDWQGIILPNNKSINRMNFDVVVIKDTIYLLIDNMVYYSAKYEGIFDASGVTIGGQNVAMTVSNLHGYVFADEAEAQSYVDSKAPYQYISNYKNTINNQYNKYFGTGTNTQPGGTLMLGSSTIDFWDNTTFCGVNTWMAQTGLVDGITGYNVGIGGTCVEDWLYAYDKLVTPFAPSRLIVYVGGNDMAVKGDTGANTFNEVVTLLEKLHTDFPDSKVYYIYTQISPSGFANGAFTNPEYTEYVRLCKEYCDAQDWITGLEANHLLKTEDGLNPHPDLFYKDGVHMNEAGYGVWGQYLYEQIFANDPKPFFGSVGDYYTTSHVDITKDTGANSGTVTVSENGIAFGYIRDFQEEEFYFETKIHVNGIKSTESYPKFGLFVRNGNVRENFYVDMTTSLTATKVGRMTNTDGKDDWTTAKAVAVSNMAFSGEGETITMGVLKEGKYLHLFINGVHALSYEGTSENAAMAGIFSFNTGMTLTDYFTDCTAETIAAKKALIPRIVITRGDASVMTYDPETDTITSLMANSSTRNQAQLYDHGIPVAGDCLAISGHIALSNLKTSGSYTSQVEFQLAQDSKNFLKMTVCLFNSSTTGNKVNGVYINTADAGNGSTATGWAIPQEDGTFITKTGNTNCPNNLISSTTYEADYQVIFENGTVYFVLDGVLVYYFESTFSVEYYYLGVTRYADAVWTDTKVTYDATEIAAMTAPFRQGAEDAVTLTTNYFTESTAGVYSMTTAASVDNMVDNVKLSGSVLKAENYSVKGTLSLTDADTWGQAQVVVAADESNRYVVSLEKVGDNAYQIFAMSKLGETLWNDWRLIEHCEVNGDRSSIDFETVVIGGHIYFLVDDAICFENSRVTMTASTPGFSANNTATSTVQNLSATVFADSAEAEAYIASKSQKAYVSRFQARMDSLYTEYITNNHCAGKGGTLIFGDSNMDFWSTWEAQTGLVKYVTGYNVGIGGSTVTDWLHAYDQLIKPFEADRFVILVGGNDVNVWGDDGEVVVQRLQALFEKLHADHPDAEIYYIYTTPSPSAYSNGIYTPTKLGALVEGSKALCESLDYVQGVDVFDLMVTDDKLNSNTELFSTDRIHMNTAGYEVFSSHLYDVIFKNDPDHFFGSTGDYKTGSQWDLSADTGANSGTATVTENGVSYGYIDDFTAENFYFETKIHVNGIAATESWPKFGLFVQEGTVRHHFYVDMTTSLTSTKVGRMTATDGNYDWTNINTAEVSTMAFSGEGETITMGVLKDGKYLHLFVDGVHVLSYESDFTGTAIAGVFGFNTSMTLSEYFTDCTEQTRAAKLALLTPYAVMKGDASVMSYDAATGTITIDMDSSQTRNQAHLYSNGIPVTAKQFAVSGHVKIENTASTGTVASKIEFQAAKNTSDYVKLLVYRYDTGSSQNNSIQVTLADSGNGNSYYGYAKDNGDGTFSVVSAKQNNLPTGDPYEVDYMLIYENGTVYFVLDGQLMYRYEGTYTDMDYYFGVTALADVTLSNTQVTCEASEVAQLADPYRAEANNGISLTTENVTVNSGIYSLNTDAAVAETVLKDGTALNETYYKVGGTIYNNGTSDWAQSHIIVKSDDTHAVRFVLERTDKGYYQVFTEKKEGDENWTEWASIIHPNNKSVNRTNFDVAVIKDTIYLIINDRIYYSAQYAGIFEASGITIGGQNVSMTISNLNGTVFDDEAEAQAYVDSKPLYSYVSGFKTSINNKYNAYFGSDTTVTTGGTLLFGSSCLDYWDNTNYCGENTWQAMTGLVDSVNGYNSAIGGTTVEDWIYAYDKLIKPFGAERYLVYLGGNNITGRDDPGEYVAQKLAELFEKIHTDFPTSHIYYVHLLPMPSAFSNGAYKNAEYAKQIEAMKTYCEGKDWITGIDATSLFLTDDGLNPNTAMYSSDNVHMNAAGYQAFGEYLMPIVFRYNITVDGFESLSFESQVSNTTVTVDLSSSQYDALFAQPNFYGVKVSLKRNGSDVSVTQDGRVFTFTMPAEDVVISKGFYDIIGKTSLNAGVLTGVTQDPENGIITMTPSGTDRAFGQIMQANQEVGGIDYTFTAHVKVENITTATDGAAAEIQLGLWSKNTAGTGLANYCWIDLHRHPSDNDVYQRYSGENLMTQNASAYDGTSEFEGDIKLTVKDGTSQYFLKIQGETEWTLLYTFTRTSFANQGAYIYLGARNATVTYSDMVFTEGTT